LDARPKRLTPGGEHRARLSDLPKANAAGRRRKTPPAHVLLLRAILIDDAIQARTAWRQWLDATGEPDASFRQDDTGLRRLLPLLLDAAGRHGLPVRRDFLTALKSAYFREELRAAAVQGHLAPLLARLHEEGIQAIVINGLALAHSVYSDPVLRHCHDLDIYCGAAGADAAGVLLPRLGFRRAKGVCAREAYTHVSGLPVEVHRRLIGLTEREDVFANRYARSRPLAIGRNTVRILAPEDALLQICARGWARGGAARPGMVCDLWMLLERGQPLNWPLLMDRARRHRLLGDLDAAMAYLSGQFGELGPRAVSEFIAARGSTVRNGPVS
jgi:hypothetical protein